MTQVALITGGQRGIGLGIARALKTAGFKVALAAESAAGSDEVKSAVQELGEEAHYFKHDLRDIAGVGALLDKVEDAVGPVTTLVSNAGVPAKVRGDMLDILPENYDFVFDINLKGAFFLAQETARRMLAAKSSAYQSMLFVTSVSADMVSVERAEYCMSKAGASMMTQLFAARLAQAGIGVFELRPGIIATEMTAAVRDKYTAQIENGLVPQRRWGEPQDIGEAVVPLALGRMAYSTGAVIPVDGGLCIPRL